MTPEIYRQNVTPLTLDQLSQRVEANIAAGANYINIYFTGLAYEDELVAHLSKLKRQKA